MSTFIFDLDGTVYRDAVALPGARETIDELRATGHRVLFASNNSTRTRAEYVDQLAPMGITIEPDGLVTSGYTTGLYLKALPQPPRSLLIIGAASLGSEILAAGLDARLDESEPIDAVVVGLDRSFTYARLAAAQAAVLAGARLIATNRDPQYPASDRITPGAGSIVAAVETATLTKALTIGKPETHMYQALIDATGADPRTTVVIGDSVLSDIAAALPLNLLSVLVLTGVSRAPAPDAPVQPGLVIESMVDLLPTLRLERPDILP